MNVFSRFIGMIKEVIRRMIPHKNIESVEHIETPVSTEMINALDKWYNMYLNKADWLKQDKVKSLNLPAFICSEVARQVVLEMKWNITGKLNGKTTDKDGNNIMNPRAEYLKRNLSAVSGFCAKSWNRDAPPVV